MKTVIFEVMELVVTLCELATSPQGNDVQQGTKVGTASLLIQEKDGGKALPLFDGELDEQVSWESLAAFEKVMRLSLGRLKHDGWKYYFGFDPG